MASGAAADGLFRCVYDSCIAGGDTRERRPYHRNCGCALHKSRKDSCSHGRHKSTSVTYPIRRAWSEGSLAMAAFSASAQSSPSSSSSSSSTATAGKEEGNGVFFKV
ncbi:hypothetical protein UlMin_002902 [Ulmus minor]